ncbi:MAG: hypothetical protein AAF907_08195, partial [Planctomycetota bacterium]
FSGGGFAGARYQFSDDLAVTLGAAVLSQIEDDVLPIPLLGIEWQINDQLRLDALGTEATLSYDIFSDADYGTLSTTATVAYDFRSYRLSGDNSVAPDGVLDDDAVRLQGRLFLGASEECFGQGQRRLASRPPT